MTAARILFCACFIGGEHSYRIDLPAAVAFVLGGVQLVGCRGARGEAVVFRQCPINFFRNLSLTAELAFDEGEHGDAFEGRAALTTADDHFDGG